MQQESVEAFLSKGSSMERFRLAVLCILTALLATACDSRLERENTELKARVVKLEAAIDTLETTIVGLKETAQFYYDTSLALSNEAHYVEANQFLKKLLDRFPKNPLAAKAKALTAKNEEVIAREMFDVAYKNRLGGDIDASNRILQRIQSDYPRTGAAREAKEQLTENSRAGRTPDTRTTYPGVYSADGDFRTRSILPFERSVHDALKHQLDLNPEPDRARYATDSQWMAAVDESERRCVRTVAREFGIDEQTVKDIWGKVETLSLGL